MTPTRTRARLAQPALILSVAVASSLGGCLLAEEPGPSGSGGSNPSGGAGGTAAGSATAGAATAGTATAGAATAGAATAGTAAGGSATGGSTTGGSTTGGSTMGGAAGSGGSGTGGSGGSGGSSPGTSLSAGCGKAPTIAANMYNNGNPIAISAANRDRRYILSVPADYDNKKPYRLVIAWHQRDGNDKQMYQQNYYWLKAIPDAASSTIFVAPNGEKNGAPCTGTGNGDSGCGWPDSSGSNVALADAVVKQIEENFCIDKNKIFANGWSFGGSMSYRTACSRPLGGTGTWGVRAVAVYNGAAQLSGNCTPSKSVAFYASHGTNDDILGYDGGVSMAQTFATQNSCTWMTPTKASGNHVCTNVSGCKAGYPVEFCSFVGPHTPDPQEGGQRWQPAEVWKFFTQF
jgi:poly(3-hydroxybutyrate) depolymerase